jgi:hypothetical protein
MMKNMLKLLDRILQIIFTGAALCLALNFFLGIFAPGNTDTAFIFQVLHPVQPLLDKICAFLTLPVHKILDFLSANAPWLTDWLPAGVKAWFPVVPAAVVAKQIAQWFLMLPHDPHGRYAQDLAQARYTWMFPGSLDWRLLLALPLWSWLESLLMGLIQWAETKLYRQQLRGETKARLKAMPTESNRTF